MALVSFTFQTIPWKLPGPGHGRLSSICRGQLGELPCQSEGCKGSSKSGRRAVWPVFPSHFPLKGSLQKCRSSQGTPSAKMDRLWSWENPRSPLTWRVFGPEAAPETKRTKPTALNQTQTPLAGGWKGGLKMGRGQELLIGVLYSRGRIGR